MLKRLWKRIFGKYTVVENYNLLAKYHRYEAIVDIIDKDVKGILFIEYRDKGRSAVLFLNNKFGAKFNRSKFNKKWFVGMLYGSVFNTLSSNTSNIRVKL